MDDIWNRVRALEGQTLRTIRGKPFTVDAVSENTVTVTPASTGKSRPVRRSVIEDAWAKRLSDTDLRPSELRDNVARDDQNLSYVAAVLKAIQQG
jgi:hypothetical protein